MPDLNPNWSNVCGVPMRFICDRSSNMYRAPGFNGGGEGGGGEGGGGEGGGDGGGGEGGGGEGGGDGGGGEGGGGEGGGMGAIFAHVTPPIRLPLPTQVDCFGQLPVGLLYAYEYEKRWQMPFQYPKKA